MTDTTPILNAVERKPQLSLMVSTGRMPFTVSSVDEQDNVPDGEKRITIRFSDVTLFIQRRDVLALMSALNEAMFA